MSYLKEALPDVCHISSNVYFIFLYMCMC